MALDRLTESPGGPLLYQFRRPWRDGSTALLLDPMELLERLAALVPTAAAVARLSRPARPRARWRAAIVPEPAKPEAAHADVRSLTRWPWAWLLRRVFSLDILVCDRCGGPRRILVR